MENKKAGSTAVDNNNLIGSGISNLWTSSTNGQCQRLLRLEVSEIRGNEANGYCTDDNKDMKFVLLHEGKNDEGIRAFFTEVWELYLKVSGLCCWLMKIDGGRQ